MKPDRTGNFLSAPAGRTALGALLAAALLLFWDARLAVIPLTALVLLCLSAPFFPRFGFFLPVISRGSSGKQAVALTFDDGPDPSTTPELLTLLSKYRVKAAFFVTGKKAAAHPELIEALISGGHAVCNHTFDHDHFIMLRSARRLHRDIKSAQDVLGGLGIASIAFRPPAGMTNPRLAKVLSRLGLYLVNFSCRAFDGGNRRISGLSRRILKKVRPDDIVLLHDVRLPKQELLDDWLREIEQILIGLEAKGLTAVPLSELIGRPVMRILPENAPEGKHTGRSDPA